MRAAEPAALFSVMPNAGWPEQVAGRILYPARPEYFGDYARLFLENGASIVGGCCGTTPRHIAFMRQAMDGGPVEAIPLAVEPAENRGGGVACCDEPTRFSQKLAAGEFVVAVEMDRVSSS